jgi:UDP-2,3-diacylglucosamine hydrolase
MTTLFISDLHLHKSRPEITELFLDFLAREAVHADALYILGDLFEYWIGDDMIRQNDYQSTVAGLRDLSDSGVVIYVMHGNRDFLMGNVFEQATGCRLLNDPSLIDLYGKTVLVMHGDTLCTDDTEYMTFRAVVRDEKWRREFLDKSMKQRDEIFHSYRKISKAATAQKEPEIMDVNQHAVESIMQSHDVHHMIHGHTHRPGEHVFELDGRSARRMVLGDWFNQGSVLRCDVTGWVLANLPLTAGSKRKAGH